MRLAIGIFALLLTMLPGYAAENNPDAEINALLATVNGDPIFLGDILPYTRRAEYQASALFTGDKLADEVRRLRSEALKEEIDRRLLLAEYQRDHTGLTIPENVIEQRLDTLAESMGCRSRQDFESALRKNGTSLEKVRKQITDQVTSELLLFREVKLLTDVTPQQVYDYYRKNRERYDRPERVHIAMILISASLPEEIRKARSSEVGAELEKHPERFAALAQSYSSGPAAASGGDLGWIDQRYLRSEFAPVLKKAEAGRICGPLETPEGTVFLQLIEKDVPKESGFLLHEAQIRAELEKQIRAEKLEKFLKKLRKTALIRYFF